MATFTQAAAPVSPTIADVWWDTSALPTVTRKIYTGDGWKVQALDQYLYGVDATTGVDPNTSKLLRATYVLIELLVQHLRGHT